MECLCDPDKRWLKTVIKAAELHLHFEMLSSFVQHTAEKKL